MAPGSFLQHAQAITATALLGLLVLLATSLVAVDGYRHIHAPAPEDAHPPVELIYAPVPAPSVESAAETEVVTLPPDVYNALPGRKGRVPYPIHYSPPPPHKWGSSSSNEEEAAAVVTQEAQPDIGGDFPLPDLGRPPYNLKKSPPPPSPPKHKGEGDSKFQLPVPIIIPIPFPPEDTDKKAQPAAQLEALGEGDSKLQQAAEPACNIFILIPDIPSYVPACNFFIPMPDPPRDEDTVEAQQEGEATVSGDNSKVYPIPGHPPHRKIPRSPAPAPGHHGGPYGRD